MRAAWSCSFLIEDGLQFVDGLLAALRVPESPDELYHAAHPVEGRDLQYVGIVEIEDGPVRVFRK